jgi:hypothetical protein
MAMLSLVAYIISSGTVYHFHRSGPSTEYSIMATPRSNACRSPIAIKTVYPNQPPTQWHLSYSTGGPAQTGA